MIQRDKNSACSVSLTYIIHQKPKYLHNFFLLAYDCHFRQGITCFEYNRTEMMRRHSSRFISATISVVCLNNVMVKFI